MKKIHITMVGGQITPVQNGIKYINPDEILFICSKQSLEDAKKWYKKAAAQGNEDSKASLEEVVAELAKSSR
jgi:hypothetical protein